MPPQDPLEFEAQTLRGAPRPGVLQVGEPLGAAEGEAGDLCWVEHSGGGGGSFAGGGAGRGIGGIEGVVQQQAAGVGVDEGALVVGEDI